VAFVVVLTSLMLQGWTAGPIARRLGLALVGHVEPRRVDLGEPIRTKDELVGYVVQHSAPILAGAELPAQARLGFIVRGNEIRFVEELKEEGAVSPLAIASTSWRLEAPLRPWTAFLRQPRPTRPPSPEFPSATFTRLQRSRACVLSSVVASSGHDPELPTIPSRRLLWGHRSGGLRVVTRSSFSGSRIWLAVMRRRGPSIDGYFEPQRLPSGSCHPRQES
jgi:hypothetical protein